MRDVPGTKKRKPAALAVALLAAGGMIASGCMMSPFSHQVVASRGTTITFNGFDNLANNMSTIKVSSNIAGAWTNLKTVTSASSSTGSWDGHNWYAWSTTGVIPNAHWVAGHHGWKTHVKTRRNNDSQDMMSVRSDFVDCWEDHAAGGVNEVYDECSAAEDPVAIVKDAAYTGSCFISFTAEWADWDCDCCRDDYTCTEFGKNHSHAPYECGGTCIFGSC